MASRRQELLSALIDGEISVTSLGAGKKSKRPRQTGISAAQVQQFLLAVKIRAMAGDPQAIALLQQYQQIVSPPSGSALPQPDMTPGTADPSAAMPSPDGSYPPGPPPQYLQPYQTPDGPPPPDMASPPTAGPPVAGWSNNERRSPMATRDQELLGNYLDALSGDWIPPSPPWISPGQSSQYQGGRRRHRHHHRGSGGGANQQQRLANLQARAAAGDQTAAAKLQQIQQRLTTELQTINTPATATAPGVTTPALAAYAAPGTALPAAPGTALPGTLAFSTQYSNPPAAPPVSPANIQYAYQSPYYDPSTMSPYGPPPPPPTVDVYQGDVGYNGHWAFMRGLAEGEEISAEREDRGIVSGDAIPHDNYRVAVMKAAVKSAGGKTPTTQDFYKAKAAVDKVIGQAGISVYMPGATPGRRTF